MAIFDWPASLKPSGGGYWPENVSRSGGAALNGYQQTIVSGAGRWRASFAFPVRRTQQVLDARALFAELQGQGNEILLPSFDGKRANWPVDPWSRVLHPGFTRHRRLDGTVYAEPEIPPQSQILATLAADLEIGDMQCGIVLTQGAPLRAGQYFGIGNRLHIIRSIVSVVAGVTTVNFWPSSRVVSAAGNPVKLDRPVARMKLLDDGQGLGALDGLRFADLSLEFRETLG